MTSQRGTLLPNRPQGKHQQSKSANVPVPNNGPGQSQRPKRRNPNRNGRNASVGAPNPASDQAVDTDGDSAVASSDEVVFSGSRNVKKHTQSQPSPSRILSPAKRPTVSHANSENSPSNASSTPAKSQGAYAGPTFHASPAASALPIPKFLSRSVPAKPQPGLSNLPEGYFDSGSPSSHSPPSPTRAPVSVPRGPREAPLELLFKAHREERARSTSGSQVSAPPLNSPIKLPAQSARHHVKRDSNNSTNMFPIELESESPNQHRSPPPVSLTAHRSTTAPSRIPQTGLMGLANHDPSAAQGILSQLSQIQKNSVDSTPPRSRHQGPFPFHNGSPHRSSSGPNTPAPSAREQSSDFFYGNRNLSPLFKAAQNDIGTKRNSGLRMEITADSPVLHQQNPFPPVNTNPVPDARYAPRDNNQRDVFGAPTSPRRGSMPNMQGAMASPNQFTQRTPGRRTQYPRPGWNPHGGDSRNATGNTPGTGKAKAPVANPFIPASVQAKQYAAPAKAPAGKEVDSKVPDSTVSGSTVSGSTVSGSTVSGSTVSGSAAPGSAVPESNVCDSKEPDSLSLELDLKRLLNVQD